MSGQTLLKELQKEEIKVAKDVKKMINVAISDKGLLNEVDKATVSCSVSKTPPKEISKLFEAALTKSRKSLKSYYPAANVNAKLKYNQKNGKWRAVVETTCGLKLKTLGGKSYTVQMGDTLWGIAKNHYGVGGVWTEIASANKKSIDSKGNFILAGVTLKLPKLDMPVAQCGIEMLASNVSAPKEAIKRAKNVCVPPYKLDFNATKPTTRIITGPIVAWKVTTRLTGELTAVCDLLMGSGVTLGSTSVSVEKEAMGFVSGIQVNSVGGSEMTLGAKISGATWGVKLSPSKPGTLTGFVSGQNVNFKAGRTVFSGKIGVEVTVQVMPRVRVQDLKGMVHEFWVDHGELVKGVALVGSAVVVGIAATALIASPVPGDEVVCYATAMRMMSGGMGILKYAR
ncbi:MAG: LysM peptidoglycan-binding domain-containing protein [Sulfitobacter sp.]